MMCYHVLEKIQRGLFSNTIRVFVPKMVEFILVTVLCVGTECLLESATNASTDLCITSISGPCMHWMMEYNIVESCSKISSLEEEMYQKY